MFLDRNPEQLDARSERNLEDADFEGVPVPDEREGVEHEDRPGGLAVDACVGDQRERDRPPEQFRDEVRVLAEDGDVGEHDRS